jgi:hypothetical protein
VAADAPTLPPTAASAELFLSLSSLRFLPSFVFLLFVFFLTEHIVFVTVLFLVQEREKKYLLPPSATATHVAVAFSYFKFLIFNIKIKIICLI